MKKVFFSWLLCIGSLFTIFAFIAFMDILIAILYDCGVPFIILVICILIVILAAICQIVLTIIFARFIGSQTTMKIKLIYYSVAFFIMSSPYILVPRLYLWPFVDLLHKLMK